MAHGRGRRPPAATPPDMWLTEFNLVAPRWMRRVRAPDGRARRTELAHARTKGLLRSLSPTSTPGSPRSTSTRPRQRLRPCGAGLSVDGRPRGRRRAAVCLGRLSNALLHARPRRARVRCTVESVADVAGRKQFGATARPRTRRCTTATCWPRFRSGSAIRLGRRGLRDEPGCAREPGRAVSADARGRARPRGAVRPVDGPLRARADQPGTGDRVASTARDGLAAAALPRRLNGERPTEKGGRLAALCCFRGRSGDGPLLGGC